jgi:hypothetical protein
MVKLGMGENEAAASTGRIQSLGYVTVQALAIVDIVKSLKEKGDPDEGAWLYARAAIGTSFDLMSTADREQLFLGIIAALALRVADAENKPSGGNRDGKR